MQSKTFSVKRKISFYFTYNFPYFCSTFFHEGKCRKKRPSPETEPMPTERVEEVEERCSPCPAEEACIAPTAPKMESPPPYREAVVPGESCLMAVSVRNQQIFNSFHCR